MSEAAHTLIICSPLIVLIVAMVYAAWEYYSIEKARKNDKG